MGSAGWWIVIGIVSLFDPLTLVLGIALGLLIQRRLYVVVALALIPLGHLCVHYLRNPSEPFASHAELLPFVATVGAMWTALAFAAKKSITS